MNTFKGQAGVRLAVIYPNNQRVPMSSYKELLAQREKLEKQIEEAKSREYAEVLNEIKQKMADYGITLAELGGGRAAKGAVKAGRPRAGVAPKYRDPDSGSTWSGRGKPPRWIAGLDRDAFLIEK
jgi:DNA-binding protein H-NS